MWRHLKALAVVIVLVVFIVSNPAGAADAARMVGHGLAAAGTGIGAFFVALNNG